MIENIEGVVKWFSQVRGYGFIESTTPHQFEDGTTNPDYWVHYSQIISDKKFKKLKQGDKVTFSPNRNEKGFFAVNVKVLA
jgi:CspA family cold shock protein